MSNLQLGITTVGDLLLNNCITNIVDCEKTTKLSPVKLCIPDYQRPYKWTAKNVNQLIDDIYDAMQSNQECYRLGTLILFHNTEKNLMR